MNKKELVNRLSLQMNCTTSDALKFINGFQKLVEEAIANNEDIKIQGFGKIYIRELAPRKARNPKTGEIIMQKAVKTLRYRPGKTLMEIIKGTK